MLRLPTKSRSLLGRRPFPWRQCYSHAAARPPSEPLRILFCGSDDFSCASLKAVHEEHGRNKGLIESLDVMVLPPKRMGRSFKTLREGEPDMYTYPRASCQATERFFFSSLQDAGGGVGAEDSPA